MHTVALTSQNQCTNTTYIIVFIHMKTHIKLIIGMLVVVVAASGAWLYFNTSTSSSRIANGISTAPSATTTSKTYTLVDVAQHNSASSCWSTINGGVYDLTSWISKHPGGQQAILSLCGTDGSAAFNAQHGGQRRPANELAGFQIGTLSTQ